MKLTVYFDSDFWYGLIEYETKNGNYGAFKVLFGKEPKDSELLEFINQRLFDLVEQNEHLTKKTAQTLQTPKKKRNPKRIQRQINKEKQKSVVSTKAQIAMNEAREALKTQKKAISKTEKERLKAARFLQKQEKRRQKKKGH